MGSLCTVQKSPRPRVKLYPFFHDEIWTEYPLNDILQFATENDRLKMSPLGLFVNMETLCGRVRVHITFSVHTLCGRPLSSGPQCVCYTCSHVHVVYYGNCMLCFICSQTKTHVPYFMDHYNFTCLNFLSYTYSSSNLLRYIFSLTWTHKN